MTELPPELQEVQAAFIANYANGGIEACHAMVADLQQELDMVNAVGEETKSIDADTIELQTVLPPEEVISRFELTRGVTLDRIEATSRHSFALFLLGIVEEPKS